MKVKGYLPFTLPVVFDAPEDATEEELTELAYTAAREMMAFGPDVVCDELYWDENEPDFESAGEEELSVDAAKRRGWKS